jgi:hypothetical protein
MSTEISLNSKGFRVMIAFSYRKKRLSNKRIVFQAISEIRERSMSYTINQSSNNVRKSFCIFFEICNVLVR